MPEILVQALSTDGLIWLLLAVIAAGLVRGFSGFGSAMIIMPVASSVLQPIEAVIFVVATEMLGPLPNLRSALREGTLKDVGLLVLGAVLMLPLGLWFLNFADPVFFGWFISAAVIILLILMATGWRYKGAMTPKLIVGTGGVGGFMTGFSGIPGPPVIMLYMASTLPISAIRANFLLYLFGIDLVLFPLLWGSGMMVWEAAVLGFLIGIPNLIANAVGALMFDPNAERKFRLIAYTIIAASAVIGLPLWKG